MESWIGKANATPGWRLSLHWSWRFPLFRCSFARCKLPPWLLLSLFLFPGFSDAEEPASRVRAGLQVLFDFSNRDSLIDSSGMRRPVEMLVETPDTVRREPGFLNFNDRSLVRSKTRAVKIHQSCCWTNELTVEVWIEPADDQQKGPARILSF